MNKWIFRSLLFLTLLPTQARDLNYMEAQAFRLSSYERSEEWIQPFYRYHKKSFPKLRLTIFASAHPETKDLIDDIDSKDNALIEKRLNSSYGSPYDAYAKIQISYRYEKFTQTFSTNSGAVAIVNDPVFPELKGILFHDYIATSSYIFEYDKNLTIIPRIVYGKRRVLDTSLTVAELIESKPNTKIKSQAWNEILDISILSRIEFEILDLLFEVNSLPIISNSFQYWDTNLGLKSKNLKDHMGLAQMRRLDAYISYSPFYGGEYDVIRTIKAGVGVEFNNYLLLDIFFQDKFQFGAIAKLNLEYLSLSLFTHSSSYDDYHTQLSRKFGLAFSLQY